MSNGPTEDALMPVTCGKCGHTAKKPIRWLRSNTIKCEGCGDDISVSIDQDSIATADELKGMMKTWEVIKKIFKS